MKKILKSVPFLYQSALSVRHSRWSKATRKSLSKYLSENHPSKLQLGAGSNNLQGWFNTDYFPRNNIFFLDVTKPFPAPSNSFQFVFSEHHIEHISYKYAVGMLKEVFRIMKPDGYIRIATPNLQQYLSSYFDANHLKTEKEQFVRDWIYGGFYNAANYIPVDNYSDAHFVNDAFLNYEHQFIYDFKALASILASAGFVNIVDVSRKESTHPWFQNIETHTGTMERYLTLSVEAQKPAL